MARVTSGDTQAQRCLTEQIYKEEHAALNFFIENMSKPANKSRASDVFRKRLDQMRADTTACEKLTAEAHRRSEERMQKSKMEQIRSRPEYTSEDLAKALDMRPASPPTKALLYDGISHEGRGRKQYLTARYKKDPEDKFPFQLPSSWDYGWHFSRNENKELVKKSTHGHVSIVENTFYTRTGIPMGEPLVAKPWYG